MSKKSFLLYDDMAAPIETLSDEDAGRLLKHIFAYRNNTNGLEPLTGGVAMAFQFIKQQIERDTEKWEERAERSRKNGSKGGRPPKNKKPGKPSGLFRNPENPDEPRKPVNVNVNVNVNDNVKKIKNPNYVEMVDLLISRIEENDPLYFKNNKETKRNNWYNPIRLLVEKDKIPLEEIRKVIDWCQSDPFWKTNILSTTKLREKFPDLHMKMVSKSTSSVPKEDNIIRIPQSDFLERMNNG